MSALQWWTVMAVLAAVGTASAQSAEKPRDVAPEPQRRSPSSRTVSLVVVQYDVLDPNRDVFTQAPGELARFVGQQERLRLQVQWRRLTLGDPGIAAATLLYMTGWDAVLRLGEAERTSLGKYLLSGGLIFGDDIRHTDPNTGLVGLGAGTAGTPFDRQFKELLRSPDVLGEAGERWERVPKDHALYAIVFGFPDGPPLGGAWGGNVVDLEMLQHRGRVVALFSDLNISYYWGDLLGDPRARERGLQFGANLLVFALTQRMGW
jgi:hypothetical protein